MPLSVLVERGSLVSGTLRGMNVNQPNESLKTYIGFIWVDDQPGTRLSVRAKGLEDARAAVVAKYGEGHVISLWNEDDASKPRHPKDA